MNDSIHIAGVGRVPFVKPGGSPPYHDLGARAAVAALADAGLDFMDVDQAFVGYVYGDSTCGQRTLYGLGMAGIPIFNVNNSCATGASALVLARQAVASGAADCALALGFDQLRPELPFPRDVSRPAPTEPIELAAEALIGHSEAPQAIRYFAAAGAAHMARYGTAASSFAQVRAKASRHARHNPYALLRRELSAEEVMASPALSAPLTRLMACPPASGAAAVLVCSEAFRRRRGLRRCVRIRAQAMVSDRPATLDAADIIYTVGYDMSQGAADAAYAMAGLGPEDVDVVELHDGFASNELITYEALGLAAPGEGERMVVDGDNTYGGRWVVNPSGGMMSMGHPPGATGLAQCAELVEQLRGEAQARQVPAARIGLGHNLGIGGACVVSIYEAA